MKKNSLLILSVFCILFISLIGCEDNAKPTPTPTPTPDTNTEYTVTFDAGTGGTLTSAATVKVKSGEKVAKPTDPTREGFTFVEWRKTGATAAFNFATETITDNITLTAEWRAITFTVTFAGESINIQPQTVPDGGMANRPPANPTRAGFTFVDWYKEATFNELYDFSTTVTVDITVYARWLSNTKYTVTFEPDQGVLVGGNDNNTVQISEGEKLPKPLDPTRADHTFVNWQKEGGTAFDFDTETITAPITLTATWADAVGSLADVAIVLNDANTAYKVNYKYTNPQGSNTGGTPETTWFLSDNANGTAPTKVSMEATYIPTGVNRYKYLVASVRVGATEGFTSRVRAVISPGFSTEATSGATSTRFSARYDHTSVRFKDKIWVIGGNDGTNRLDDVWSSEDGSNWVKASGPTEQNPRFSARAGHTSVVFKDAIWVIGGDDGDLKNDVWSSKDGSNWVKKADSTEQNPRFSSREQHTSVRFKDKIWVIGGDDGKLKNDVWSSEDGETWTQVTSKAAFPVRYKHASVAFDGKMWVIGRNLKNDVWSSKDGATWTQVSDPMTGAAFSDRDSHTSVAFDGKIWVIGGFGFDLVGNNKNDVWSSSDGRNWIEYQEVARLSRFSIRSDHTSVVFNGKIWVIGGRVSGTDRSNNVWY